MQPNIPDNDSPTSDEVVVTAEAISTMIAAMTEDRACDSYEGLSAVPDELNGVYEIGIGREMGRRRQA